MLGLLSIAAAWAKEAPAPLCQFLALDVGTLLAIAAGWEVVYQLAKRVTSGNPHEKVAHYADTHVPEPLRTVRTDYAYQPPA